jgi:solute carrier family 9 (sodium/hydrogen exchanger), member 8
MRWHSFCFHVFSHFVEKTKQYHDESGAVLGSIVERVLIFFLQFLLTAILSPILGIGLGVVVALIFKHYDMRQHPKLELAIYIILMYIPFLIAERFHLSGIVAIFFTGMSANRYASPNVSAMTLHDAGAMFRLAAYVAETAIFLELGLSLFGLPMGSFHWVFIGCAFAAALLGRGLSIYPLAYLYNVSLRQLPEDDDDSVAAVGPAATGGVTRRRTPAKRKDQKISMDKAHIVWFAGLRGAVAYACARKFSTVYGHQDEK